MLKERVITGLILVALFLSAIFGLDSRQFALVIAGVVILAAWEWAGLAGWGQRAQRAVYTALVVAALYIQANDPLPLLDYLVCGWWALAFLLVVSYPASAVVWARYPIVALLIGLLLLVSTWQAVVILQAKGYLGISAPWSLLYPVLLVVASDTGAYFSGRAFGRNKLAPKASPGKTWEGLAGGVALASAIAIGVAWYLGLSRDTGAQFVLLSIVVSLVSVVGDLFESIVKRERGVKDSGSLLPGHGGLFDRLDSVVAALPVFVAGMHFLRLDQFSLFRLLG